MANMTRDELDLYDKAGIAIADARGRVEQARKDGKLEERMEMLLDLLQDRFGAIPDWARIKLAEADLNTLKGWSKKIFSADKIEHIFQ
ncbi:MAG: hypothetical protein HQL07_18210 [Nitrospirae bacterium]|nr:hypothetical protein [Magnetococcales bacterium]